MEPAQQFPYQTPDMDEAPPAQIPPAGGEGAGWKTKVFLWSVALVAALAVLLAVGAVAYRKMSALPVEVVMARMVERMGTVESFSLTYTLSATISGEEQAGVNAVDVRGSLVADVRDASKTIEAGAHTLVISFSPNAPAQSLGISSVAISLEERSVDSTARYLRFTRLPTLGIISLSPFENKWMKVDQSVEASMAKGIDRSKIGAWWSAVRTDSALTASIEDKGKEKLQGVSAYHYRVILNPERVRRHLQEVLRIAGYTFTLQEETALRTSLAEALPKTPIDVLIGTKDFRVYRIMVPLQVSGAGSVGASGTFELSMSGYNAPVRVEAPSDARPILDVVGEVLQTVGGFASSGNFDISRFRNEQPSGPDTDFDGVADDQERSLGTNPSSADTDSDGIIDGDEVNKYHTNPLKADTDGDGLTDGEEILRWRTEPTKADTDGDTYTDGQEVRNGYDPLGPGKLPK